jgi:hypothetical protein
MAALALRAGYPVETIRRMVCVQSARTIVALFWKTGFSARFAMDLQRQLAGILPTKIVNARDGVYIRPQHLGNAKIAVAVRLKPRSPCTATDRAWRRHCR